MSNERLTGSFRYRPKTRLFRRPLLILEVEVEVQHGPHYDMDGFGQIEQLAPAGSYKIWRDARMEDLPFVYGKGEPS